MQEREGIIAEVKTEYKMGQDLRVAHSNGKEAKRMCAEWVGGMRGGYMLCVGAAVLG